MTDYSKADVVEVMARAIAAEDDATGGSRYSAYWLNLARAALTALEEAGYVTVPREPTEAMIGAGAVAEGDGNLSVQALNIYAAMLAASPLGAKEVKKTPGIYHPQKTFEGEPPATDG